MNNAKPVTVPFATHFKLSADMSPKTDEEMEHMSSVSYSIATGSIMYAMICNQFDISHLVSIVSRYMACPGKEHWQAVKWILRYLKGTINVGLTFHRAKMSDLVVGYVDSNFARDLDKRRSLTGYLFTLSGTAISWKATLQATITLSTIKAEYMALVEAVKEANSNLEVEMGSEEYLGLVDCYRID
ncbi:hypothetical protein GH714_013270 [Hevea brasiliensis]|uniref:Reverse transcriptase Ty1/copia-type domain-containing protein n=1 Tax=Hevea brasiliensis TaxID=3981 RepID=A0A6A6KBW6_HEVBR|nr:hypothetical protein GH714_013227 [Hevea brasiliensis]KAF2286287.1 hypothetical protein GH714_013270 [Hevea brasiliensis]